MTGDLFLLAVYGCALCLLACVGCGVVAWLGRDEDELIDPRALARLTVAADRRRNEATRSRDAFQRAATRHLDRVRVERSDGRR